MASDKEVLLESIYEFQGVLQEGIGSAMRSAGRFAFSKGKSAVGAAVRGGRAAGRGAKKAGGFAFDKGKAGAFATGRGAKKAGGFAFGKARGAAEATGGAMSRGTMRAGQSIRKAGVSMGNHPGTAGAIGIGAVGAAGAGGGLAALKRRKKEDNSFGGRIKRRLGR